MHTINALTKIMGCCISEQNLILLPCVMGVALQRKIAYYTVSEITPLSKNRFVKNIILIHDIGALNSPLDTKSVVFPEYCYSVYP